MWLDLEPTNSCCSLPSSYHLRTRTCYLRRFQSSRTPSRTASLLRLATKERKEQKNSCRQLCSTRTGDLLSNHPSLQPFSSEPNTEVTIHRHLCLDLQLTRKGKKEKKIESPRSRKTFSFFVPTTISIEIVVVAFVFTSKPRPTNHNSSSLYLLNPHLVKAIKTENHSHLRLFQLLRAHLSQPSLCQESSQPETLLLPSKNKK